GGRALLVSGHDGEGVKCAGWVVDLGPEGGAEGGRLLAAGPPETIAATPGSHTGRFLAEALQPGSLVAETSAALVTSPAVTDGHILVVGAREHNLRDLSAQLPPAPFLV